MSKHSQFPVLKTYIFDFKICHSSTNFPKRVTKNLTTVPKKNHSLKQTHFDSVQLRTLTVVHCLFIPDQNRGSLQKPKKGWGSVELHNRHHVQKNMLKFVYHLARPKRAPLEYKTKAASHQKSFSRNPRFASKMSLFFRPNPRERTEKTHMPIRP